MITISLCMIVKNEEETLARCLDCIKDLADEIIIVDTGSNDETNEIAKQYTSGLYHFDWIDDFAAARNFAFSKASMDYLMWLDADDIITPEDQKKLLLLKESLDPSIDVVMMKYCTGVDEKNKYTLSYYRERWIKRSRNFQWHEPVHEYLDFSGSTVNTDISILHKKGKVSDSSRNLNIFEKTLKENGSLSPRSMYYYSRELMYAGKYENAVKQYEIFLDIEKGWVEDNINACGELASCYMNLKNNSMRLKSLLRAFGYDTPRAETCCGLGYYYMDLQDYNKAIFWFDLATKLKKPVNNWGFILHDSWDFIPFIQLCVCYDKLGLTDEAVRCNEKAAEYKPDHPSVQFNRDYFKSLAKSKKLTEPIPATPRSNINTEASKTGSKLTLSLLVHNEAGNFLESALAEHSRFIHEAVVIDDASTDDSVRICYEKLRKLPLHIAHNPVSRFSNEIELRKQQWNETIKTDPDWILFLDADEIFEGSFKHEIGKLMNQSEIDVFCFRLYDFWDESHYREDGYWHAHQYYRPFLVRYRKDFKYLWEETPQHCGRLPKNILSLPNAVSQLRLKHLGWSKPGLRTAKYERYMKLDPDARYGIKGQYDSILDENPKLIEWIE